MIKLGFAEKLAFPLNGRVQVFSMEIGSHIINIS